MIRLYAVAIIVGMLWATYGADVALCALVAGALVVLGLWVHWRGWCGREGAGARGLGGIEA